MEIKTTHLGEDYGTVEINGEEFQTSLGLAEEIHEANKTITLNYYAQQDLPALGSVFEKDGKKYEVINNSILNQSTAKEIN